MKIGIAFGAGGARGLAHVHVALALDDLGIRPDVIAGCSMGSLVGALVASGMSGEELKGHVLASAGGYGRLASRLWSTIRGLRAPGIVGLPRLERILPAFLPSEMVGEIEALQVPFAAVACDFYSGEPHVFRSGPLLQAICASSAIPGVFRPVTVDGSVLVDGGVVNPVPVDLLPDADVRLAVDVVGLPVNRGVLPGAVESAYGASQLFQGTVARLRYAVTPPHVLIKPPVSDVKPLDFARTRAILDATASTREDAKRAISEAIEGATRT